MAWRLSPKVAWQAPLLLALLLPWGCSSDEALPQQDPAPDAGVDAGPAPAWSLELEANVAAGDEATVCRYFVVPEEGLRVARFAHTLSEHTHHLLLFPTYLTPDQIPVDGIIHDCEGDSPNKLVAPGILYGGQPGGAEVAFPVGSALNLPGGAVVLMEQHVVNTSADGVHAHARLDLFSAQGAAATREAGMLHFYDWAIYVPARGEGRAEMQCDIPADIELAFGHGHMHQRGTRFQAWIIDPDGERHELLETRDWDSETQSFDPGVKIAAGSRVRFACDYQNADDRPYYQGLSAVENEMCSLTLGYAGEDGKRLPPPYEWCGAPTSGVVGAGGFGCQSIEQCIASAFSDGLEGFGTGLQACWNQGCELAPVAFRDLALCRAAHCEAVCDVPAGLAGVVALAATSLGCLECVAASCPEQQQACAAQPDCS